MNSDDMTVIVTTAPRIECYLEDTVNSIEACGWTPTIFAEPGSTKTKFNTIEWEKKKGLWHNWKAAVEWAITQNTKYIMTVQDDCLMHPETKQLVDRIPTLPLMGYLSLYTPSHYQEDHNGNPVKGLYTVSVASAWGALALIFERDMLIKLLNDIRVQNWLGIKPPDMPYEKWRINQLQHPEQIKNSDYIIGSSLTHSFGKFLYYISPSPCFHLARYSSVGHSGNGGKRNTKYPAKHDQPLFPQVFDDELSVFKIGDMRVSKSDRKDTVYYYPENMQLMSK